MYESYVCSRVPAEAITIATFTYVSFMKYSAILTSAICEKKIFMGSIVLLDSMWGINATILLINWRGNRKHLLIGGNLLEQRLFDTVRSADHFTLSAFYTVSSLLQSA